MRKLATSKFAVMAGVVIALCVSIFSPVAHAGAPFSGKGTGASAPYHDRTYQDPHWLALKYAFRIRSGVVPGEGMILPQNWTGPYVREAESLKRSEKRA